MTTISPPWPPLFMTTNFRLKPNTAIFTSPLTGSMQPSARDGDQWQCDIEFPIMARADHDDWSALLSDAASSAQAIYLNDYKNARPRNYPNGTDGAITCDSAIITCDSATVKCDSAFSFGAPYVNGAGQVGRSLLTGGWLANAPIYAGTWLAFHDGVRVALHKVARPGATADSSGNASVPITPPIRRSPAHLMEIRLDGNCAAIAHRCCGEFLIVPGQPVGWTANRGHQQIDKITAIEYLR